MTLTVNQSLTTGIFPQKLKIAKVSPLYKNSDATIIENYRPISLLTVISKKIVKVIFQQINRYFTENKLFNISQYGFRENHFTELAALELIDRLTTYMNNWDIPITIFLDLSKAFDTLNHSILLDKLKHFGIKDGAFNLLNSYLSDRQQFVQISNIKYSLLPVETGVLGPLLFIIYQNDFTNASDIFKIISYADDSTLLAKLSDFINRDNKKNINVLPNRWFEKNCVWLKINRLSLNNSKFKFMLFYQRQKSLTIPNIKINNTDLQCIDNFNFGGLIFNKHLGWADHVNRLSNKICRIIGIMNKLKFQLPQNILLTIYNSLILSQPVAMSRNIYINFKKQVIRIIDKSPRFSHTNPFKPAQILQ